MSDTQNQTAETPAEPAVTRESLLAEQQRYIDRFGAEDGVQWFTEGMEYTKALEQFADKQSQKVVGLETQLAEEREKLASLSLGEDEPADTGIPESEAKKSKTFAEYTRPSSN